MTRDNEMAPGVYRSLPPHDSGIHYSDGGALSPSIGKLIEQTWAEMEEARDRYNRDAKRLRYWRWWFLGMFTFYTSLVGILLLKLFVGS